MVEKLQPDVILLQEIKSEPRVDPLIEPKNGEFKEVSAKQKEESRILYYKGKFTCYSPVSLSNPRAMLLSHVLDDSIRKAVPSETRITRSGKVGWQETFKDRISIVGLTRQGYNIVFLSYHNPYSGLSDAALKTSSKQLCHIVSKISKETDCIVVAGADLNCELAPGNYHGATVYNYKLARRKTKIDHFIIASPAGISITPSVKALNFVSTKLTGDADSNKLHELMTSFKSKFMHHEYHKAIDKGLDDALGKALKKSLDEAMKKGLSKSTLTEALKKGLDEASLDKETLYKGLLATLPEPLDKDLDGRFYGTVNKTLDHDPVLLDLTIQA